MSANTIIEQLQQTQADATVFYQRLRNFHWNVTGPQFFGLHEFFEKQYDAWATFIDDVAERILQLGGKPLPTLAAALEKASLTESADAPNARGMMQQTVEDLRFQVERWRSVIDSAEKAGDRTTANLIDPAIDDTSKTLWMLEAWLKA